MEVRLLTKREIPEYQKISAASFMWKFNPETDNELKDGVYGAFDDKGRLVAGLETPLFTGNYCGKLLPVIGIGGVAAMPEYRRGGSVRAIFNELERLAPEKGWAMGFLYPFSINYYSKFGYAYTNRLISVSVDFAKLTAFERSNSVTLFDGKGFDELFALHNKCALRYNLMTLREDKHFFCDKPFENARYTYIWRYPDGSAGAYADFEIDRQTKSLNARDLWFLDGEALRGIIGFLRNYDGVASKLVIGHLPQTSALLDLFSQVDGVAYSFAGCPAGRIYDLPTILKANDYPQSTGRFVLRCIDSVEQNNGVFEVEYSGGRCCVTENSGAEPDITLDACACARILLSGRGFTAESARVLDGVELDGNCVDFFRAFPHRPTAFIEGF